MYNEEFSHMKKSVQSDVSFFLKVQTAQAKTKLTIYNLISTRSITEGNINNL